MIQRFRQWITLVPGLVLLLAGLVIEVAFGPVLALRLQAGVGVIAMTSGLMLGLLAGFILWLQAQQADARRRLLAQERRAQDEAHRQFLRRLNHELKNPLTAIRVGLANLENDGGQDVSAATSLTNVRRQIERLSRLTDDLRKLADLEGTALERAPVDLAAVVEEALETALLTREGRKISVAVQRAPWPVNPVPSDRDLLFLAIYNLLDNALKFSTPEATVEVHLAEDGTRAIVEVADTGQGIPLEELAHVSEELYRGRAAQGADGSGLGLALVERIASLHGGELVIRSREGCGTVASLRLPFGKQ